MSRKRDKKPNVSIPSVRMAMPKNRPIQLRYYCPLERREVRVSTGSYDQEEAEQQKRTLEAKLLLGIPAKRKARLEGPDMLWEDFRESYRTIQLSTISESSAIHAESRLDVAERVLTPRRLADIARPDAIHKLQSELLQGAESRFKRPRSPHTVKSYVTSVLAAINWAHLQGWIESPPKIRKIKVGKLKKMKGRPVTSKEFGQMINAVESVVGEKAAPSWKYLLKGLWESALRLDEIMHVSWDDTNMITPKWQSDKLPVLSIPESQQKNACEEDIPLLPGFEVVLKQTPENKRKGRVFNPMSLQHKAGRNPLKNRMTTDRIGKIISKIGENAKIVVQPENNITERPAKYASAHDLRRSCAQRLLDAGVPPLVISRILRHANWETTQKHYVPGNVQKDAEVLSRLLG